MFQQRICKQCGCSFTGGPRAYYCPSCREKRRRERERNYKKYGHARALGSVDECKRCGEDYIVNAGLQQFCPKCQRIHALEYDREHGLKYYITNKMKINPARNMKRRKRPMVCSICGKPLKAGALYCGAKCKREGQKRRYKKWYVKKRKK
jgi:ribosomal protein S18